MEYYISNINYDVETVQEKFDVLLGIKRILGNFDTDVSYLSTIMAKHYILENYDVNNFDVSSKSQSAPGLDIDVLTKDALRLVAEIKSTVPYLKNDFRSNQKISIRNDIRKLKESSADIKIMFVTDPLAYEILRDKYIDINDKINLVLLTE